jgi:hypothetical protein
MVRISSILLLQFPQLVVSWRNFMFRNWNNRDTAGSGTTTVSLTLKDLLPSSTNTTTNNSQLGNANNALESGGSGDEDEDGSSGDEANGNANHGPPVPPTNKKGKLYECPSCKKVHTAYSTNSIVVV